MSGDFRRWVQSLSIQGLGFRVKGGLGFRVDGLGFRVKS